MMLGDIQAKHYGFISTYRISVHVLCTHLI